MSFFGININNNALFQHASYMINTNICHPSFFSVSIFPAFNFSAPFIDYFSPSYNLNRPLMSFKNPFDQISSGPNYQDSNLFNMSDTGENLFRKPIFDSPNFNINSSYNKNLLSNIFKKPDFSLHSLNTTTSTSSSTLLPELKEAGYNAEKGQKIAQEIRKGINGTTGQCGAYVGNAIARAGYMDKNLRGRDGYKYPELLVGNPNFKEISTKNLDLSKLPAGCIMSYDRGVSGYSKTDGHVQVTLGDGTAGSDSHNKKMKPGARVFIPV